jgi:membrane-associated protease RseP (regulator of RpoE activity)
MLLDSGTNMTALSNSAWQTLPSSWRPNSWVEGLQSSGSPPGSLLACVPALRLGDMALGGMVLHDQPIRVIMPAQSGSFADPSFAGILGGDILERFDVTLDLQHASMYLKPAVGFRPDPYEFVTIGIQFLKASAEAFSVVAVWKHSPAEAAGVVVGDRIVSVNGHSSAGLDPETFANQLHGAAGTPVVIEVERATGRLTLHMKTRQLVCESSVT